jgi:F-type H+-transporting ATPase subunit delta
MTHPTLAKTYAEALFALAIERGLVDVIHDEVEFFEKLLGEDKEFLVFVETLSVEREEKRKVFETVLRGKVSDEFLNFLLLVVRRGRQLLLRAMLAAFRALHDAKIGRMHARAVTAVSISPEVREALRVRLEAAFQKKIVIHNVVDERILGGFVVSCGGYVADGSLIADLDRIERRLRDLKLGSEFVHEN